MPRRSGGGMRSGSSSSSAPRRSAGVAATPQSAAPARPGMLSGLGGTIAQGMAFGAGSEVAHQAVRSMMGGSSSHAAEQTQDHQQTQADPCFNHNQDFLSCLKASPNDISMCQSYLDLLKSCRSSY